jgi:hypothetical protein
LQPSDVLQVHLQGWAGRAVTEGCRRQSTRLHLSVSRGSVRVSYFSTYRVGGWHVPKSILHFGTSLVGTSTP